MSDNRRGDQMPANYIEVTARGNKVLLGTLVRDSNGRISYAEFLGEDSQVRATVANINDNGSKAETRVTHYEDGVVKNTYAIKREHNKETVYRVLPNREFYEGLCIGGLYNTNVLPVKPVQKVESNGEQDGESNQPKDRDSQMDSFTLLIGPEEEPADRFYQMLLARIPVPMLEHWKHELWALAQDIKTGSTSVVTRLMCVGMEPCYQQAYRVAITPKVLEDMITRLGRGGRLKSSIDREAK